MEKAKLSVIQMFAIMLIFNLGSALVVSLGSEAGKDAWLSILIGMGGGVALFFLYYILFRKYPTLPLTGYARKIFGRYLGWCVGLLYVIYFLYSASRNLRDFSDLMLTSSLPQTPLLAISILLILTSCYVLYLGIEVLARTGEVFIVILILFGILGNTFILLSGNFDFQHLRPLLENGWKPVFTTAFPLLTYFPFGEIIIFTMLLPYLNRPELVKNVGISTIILSGIILSGTAALNISVLGVEEVERAIFPLLSTVGKVNLFDFIQRLDALVIFPFLITMFFKISLFFYGAVIGIVDLFKLKTHRQIIFPAGIIVLFLSVTIASDFTEHIEEGTGIAPYILHIPLHILLPAIMLVIAFIQHRFSTKVI
ncbi:GerAB/ArcD/ProY family transporter [Alteribacillus sp. HJP-4]|uniref:GerAB/ArcD/ProY family transporter n=1 Tax=Alteribacillus sp. HJP-4 TaxID=2775394 RepID=UPI0035CD2351